MMMSPEHAELIDHIYDDAIALHGSDHLAAASTVLDELRSLEAAGHVWVSTLLDAAMLDSIKRKVKARFKRARVTVPSKTGASAKMPVAYSRRNAEGHQQMVLWVDIPLSELLELIDSMDTKAAVLLQRQNRMQHGYDLAMKHGVGTAREGFAAEGIDIATVVAA